MTTTARGVVARTEGEPVTVEEVIVPDSGSGEALVRSVVVW